MLRRVQRKKCIILSAVGIANADLQDKRKNCRKSPLHCWNVCRNFVFHSFLAVSVSDCSFFRVCTCMFFFYICDCLSFRLFITCNHHWYQDIRRIPTHTHAHTLNVHHFLETVHFAFSFHYGFCLNSWFRNAKKFDMHCTISTLCSSEIYTQTYTLTYFITISQLQNAHYNECAYSLWLLYNFAGSFFLLSLNFIVL